MRLSPSEMRTIIAALRIAVLSEEELIRCHTNKYSGKSIDPKLTKRTAAMIRLMKTLDRKLCKELDAKGTP